MINFIIFASSPHFPLTPDQIHPSIESRSPEMLSSYNTLNDSPPQCARLYPLLKKAYWAFHEDSRVLYHHSFSPITPQVLEDIRRIVEDQSPELEEIPLTPINSHPVSCQSKKERLGLESPQYTQLSTMLEESPLTPKNSGPVLYRLRKKSTNYLWN